MHKPDHRLKLVFVINPISGAGRGDRVENCLKRYLDHQKFNYSVHRTTRPGDATRLATEAVREGADAVVAVGGDGTINEVARGLVNTEVYLGIIPSGSGNGLALHLKIPVRMKKAIRVINGWRPLKIDTATINDGFFVSVAGAGFDAMVARKFSRAPRRGFWSYFRITVASYFRYRQKKYRLVIDGMEIERKALLISFANSSQFGNNTSIDPGASLNDGFIDVCIVRKVPFHRIIFMLPLLFLKKFDRTEYVEIFRAREVRVSRKKGKSVHLDGDPVNIGKEFVMKINPQSLFILIP